MENKELTVECGIVNGGLETKITNNTEAEINIRRIELVEADTETLIICVQRAITTVKAKLKNGDIKLCELYNIIKLSLCTR